MPRQVLWLIALCGFLLAAAILSGCAGPASPQPSGVPPTATRRPSPTPGPTATHPPSVTPTPSHTPPPTPTLAITPVRSDPNLPAYVDVLAFGTSLQGETLTAAFTLRALPATLTIDRLGAGPNALEYLWCALIYLDGVGAVKGAKPGDYKLCALHFVPSVPGPQHEATLGSALQVNVWQNRAGNDFAIGPATLRFGPAPNTLTLVGRIPGITPKARILFQARDQLLGESYSR